MAFVRPQGAEQGADQAASSPGDCASRRCGASRSGGCGSRRPSRAAPSTSGSARIHRLRAGAVTREEIEASLADPDGAYRRLRTLMDAWCALWYWPLTGAEASPPSLDQWLRRLSDDPGNARPQPAAGRRSRSLMSAPQRLNKPELDQRVRWCPLSMGEVARKTPMARHLRPGRGPAGLLPLGAGLREHLSRGGFDVQVGNPPWVQQRRSRSPPSRR